MSTVSAECFAISQAIFALEAIAGATLTSIGTRRRILRSIGVLRIADELGFSVVLMLLRRRLFPREDGVLVCKAVEDTEDERAPTEYLQRIGCQLCVGCLERCGGPIKPNGNLYADACNGSLPERSSHSLPRMPW